MSFESTREFAQRLDAEDPLASFRDEFSFPQHEGEDALYFCGNSLGLMPKKTPAFVDEELEDWGALGVDGHFKGRRPWYSYHEIFSESAARVVGAKPSEVVVMNGLTVNVHLLMTSFYRPTEERYRILIEDTAFPSDRYAVQSQARVHGRDPEDAVVIMKPREGESLLRTKDIEAYLDKEGDKVALVLFGGVNYYTGQHYDLERIATAGHKAGAKVGFDLAHAAGNVPLQLHDWNADFACWCNYKYLNSGPGATAAAFVHERWGDDPSVPRFAGWWGTDPETRFEMGPTFSPQRGAGGWQLSNAPVLSMAPLRVSLDIFDRAGMAAMRTKSEKLTGFLEHLVAEMGEDRFSILTPREPKARGCQLSLRVHGDPKPLFARLEERGVITDVRRPDVIRVAPVPLYNRFDDVWRFAEILRETV
jgi:kynureninase